MDSKIGALHLEIDEVRIILEAKVLFECHAKRARQRAHERRETRSIET